MKSKHTSNKLQKQPNVQLLLHFSFLTILVIEDSTPIHCHGCKAFHITTIKGKSRLLNLGLEKVKSRYEEESSVYN